ncbi:enoyl-CoA hydratase/isomerase family protein [Microbacterium sp. zg.B48]|uniref:enoyl-CoA hydratase/isomerase family protein n=1 Tax=Microbacterium sp. zg.B48 TaxID=2969408 RepID=UPI00214C411D|nr:enoyl-CoA hydratase/isomerase family protein [Microbacterium sp. zg.B48]MCR2762999.1 enoyl-CoA hydratase/isomerase family protein [Microbacterium sp. zg.B48]
MTDPALSSEAPVLVRSSHGLGHLTLNRPRALNALDLRMIGDLAAALDAWEHDPDVQIVLLDGAGDRGFCAGGDVRALYEQIRSGDPEAAGGFFRAEYALNARIAEYPKPIVVLADGVTMGGGIGLAGHAAIRIVTERSQLAMPETRIGFTPDVGGSLLLAHAPGRLGEYLALTGRTMDAADAIAVGMANHFVPSADLDGLRGALATGPGTAAERVSRFLSRSADGGRPRESGLARSRDWIDDAFSAGTVADIVDRLRARPEAAASDTAAVLGELSPTGLAVTLEAVRRARDLPDLRAALAQEYGLVLWFVTSQPDLIEGIRAQLVDKDRAPRWQPATIGELAADAAASAFAYRPRIGLWG